MAGEEGAGASICVVFRAFVMVRCRVGVKTTARPHVDDDSDLAALANLDLSRSDCTAPAALSCERSAGVLGLPHMRRVVSARILIHHVSSEVQQQTRTGDNTCAHTRHL